MKKIKYEDVEDVIKLTPQMMGMMLRYLQDPTNKVNLLKVSLCIDGVVSKEQLVQAWYQVVQKHPMLRTVFRWKNISEPTAIVLKELEQDVEYIMFDNFRESIGEIGITDEEEKQFDLEKRAVRLRYINNDGKTSRVILSMHHIICDGWSTMIIVKELVNAFNGVHNSQKSYDSDYYVRYLRYIEKKNKEEYEKFWHQYMSQTRDYRVYLRKKTPREKRKILQKTFSIDKRLSSHVKSIIATKHISEAAVFFFCWGKTLECLFDLPGAVFHVTASTRTSEIANDIFDQVVGMYINTIYIQTKKEQGIFEFYKQFVKNLKYIELPVKDYYREQNELASLVVVENYPLDGLINLSNGTNRILSIKEEQDSGFDITLMVVPQTMQVILYYNQELFSEEFISRVWEQYMICLWGIMENPIKCIQSEKKNAVDWEVCTRKQKTKLKVEINRYGESIFTMTEKVLASIWSKLLKIDIESITDESDFFLLSGHSLDVIRMINEVEHILNIRMKVTDVYNYRNLSRIARHIERLKCSEAFYIQKAEHKERYLASAEQKRMYLLNEMNVNCINYNVTAAYTIHGKIDAEKFRDVFYEIVMRHEALRTTFIEEDDMIYQIIHDNVECIFEYRHEILQCSIDDIAEKYIRHFNLQEELPIRIKIGRLQERQYYLLIDMHHIITDGISTSILMKEFMDLYNGKNLAPIIYQYKDYSEWQHSREYEAYIKTKREYWINETIGEYKYAKMQHDINLIEVPEDEGQQIYFSIGKEIVSELKQIGNIFSISIFPILLSCYFLMLYKVTRNKDILVSIPVANRTVKAFENTLGMFVNTIPFHIEVNPDESYHEFINRLVKKWSEILDNQEYQIDQLYEELIKNNHGLKEMFEISFLLQNMDMPEVQLKDVTLNEYRLNNYTTKFNLIFIATQKSNTVEFEVVYRRKYFRSETIKHYIDIFRRIVTKISKRDNLLIMDILEPDNSKTNSVFSERLI